jgi:hypothetical protein
MRLRSCRSANGNFIRISDTARLKMLRSAQTASSVKPHRSVQTRPNGG